jgi:general stress protein 26
MSTENLKNQEAIEKLQEMINKIDIGMMCSQVPGSKVIHAVPMSRQEVDDEGNIWYLISTDSESYKNFEITPYANVLFSDVRDYNFLSLCGDVEISRDQARIEKYWVNAMEAWFEKGKEDPRIRVMKITPGEAHYWDNKTNKLVTLIKVATSAVTGAKMDIGREGDLEINNN